MLTRRPLMLHICVNGSGQHWFRKWCFAYSAPGHYPNQCWLIVNWVPRNKFQWNLNWNSIIFSHENAFEMSSANMVAIWSRGRRVKCWDVMKIIGLGNSLQAGRCCFSCQVYTKQYIFCMQVHTQVVSNLNTLILVSYSIYISIIDLIMFLQLCSY